MANITQAKLNHFMSETQDQLLKLFEKELVFGKYIQILINYFCIHKCINYKYYYRPSIVILYCHTLTYALCYVKVPTYVFSYSLMG